MHIRLITPPDVFGSIEKVQKTYGTPQRAEKAVFDLLDKAKHYRNTTVTVVPAQRNDGRWHPVCIFQGDDRTQACIDVARHGFMSFA